MNRSERDAFLLCRADPLLADDEREKAALDAVWRDLQQRTAKPPIRRRISARLVLVAALLTVGCTAGWLVLRTVTEPLTVACYAEASLETNIFVAAADGTDPIAPCVRAWRDGELGPSPPPALMACLLPSGVVGVFPQRPVGACGDLGLPQPGGPHPEAMTLIDLDEAVSEGLGVACLTQHEARSLIQRELDSRGLDDWQILVDDRFTSAWPCASPAFDVSRRTITIVPVPDLRLDK